MTYRERREAKADRLREWATKRQAAAGRTLQADAHYRGDHAFNTQPGHIPERARVIAREDRAHQSLGKAAEMLSRAAGIERAADHAIYSDDADAIQRLEERIDTLEAERERIKAYNASCRKGAPDGSLLTEREQRLLRSCIQFQPYACKGGQFPAYHLTNLGGNITRQKARLAQLTGVPRPRPRQWQALDAYEAASRLP